MTNTSIDTFNPHSFFDAIIVGAGIAGLWTANRLLKEGYNVIVIDAETLGGTQTLASQGMIHGGQKYTLTGKVTHHASDVATMPARWESALNGDGELDLSDAFALNDSQIMWSAGGHSAGIMDSAAVLAASKMVNAGTEKLTPEQYPDILRDMQAQKMFKGFVYEMPEQVLDSKALVKALSKNLAGRLFKGHVENMTMEGQITVGGQKLQAQAVIFTAGIGNEEVFKSMNVKKRHTQRRLLRQVMVRTIDQPLFGHGIVANPKPRVTVTSHAVEGGYVWYLGGGIAEKSASMTEVEAILFAVSEMRDMFPQIDWVNKEWATLPIDRAEPFSEDGQLPPGPHIHQFGRVLVSWPTKLTFAPGLADKVIEWIKGRNVKPEGTATGTLPVLELGAYPWETANWRYLSDLEGASETPTEKVA